MATSDSPLSVPNVTLAVARQASGGSNGGNGSISYAFSGNSIGDTLTITAESSTDFGSVGPEFVMLIDSSQRNVGGDVVPRLGVGSSDSNSVVITELENDVNMPAGSGYKMGTPDAEFGSTTPPFRMRVTCPSHFKSFESKVTYLPSARRQPVVDALIADRQLNGQRGANDWGFKNLWNAAASQNFGAATGGAGAAFYLGDLYDWNGSTEYWLTDPVIFSNVVAFTTQAFPSVDTNDPDINVPYRYWRDEPHQTEFAYDLGSLDTTLSDSVAWCSIFTPSVVVGAEERTGIYMKNDLDAQTEPMAYFTYPGYVRGFNIPDGLNVVENLHYKAVGDGRYCRVALTNHADYFQATKRTILEVSSQADWTSSQIVARLHGGWFSLASLSGKFINVIGIDNTQIASAEIL